MQSNHRSHSITPVWDPAINLRGTRSDQRPLHPSGHGFKSTKLGQWTGWGELYCPFQGHAIVQTPELPGPVPALPVQSSPVPSTDVRNRKTVQELDKKFAVRATKVSGANWYRINLAVFHLSRATGRRAGASKEAGAPACIVGRTVCAVKQSRRRDRWATVRIEIAGQPAVHLIKSLGRVINKTEGRIRQTKAREPY
ncbi:unnamed protein product [Calypogeia fissa]